MNVTLDISVGTRAGHNAKAGSGVVAGREQSTSGWGSSSVPIPTIDLFCAFSVFKRLLKLSSRSRLWDNPFSSCTGLQRNRKELGKQLVGKFMAAQARSGYLQSRLAAEFVVQARVKISLSGVGFFLHLIQGADFGLHMLLAKRSWFNLVDIPTGFMGQISVDKVCQGKKKSCGRSLCIYP